MSKKATDLFLAFLTALLFIFTVITTPVSAEAEAKSLLSSAFFLGDSTTNSLRYHAVLSGGKDTTRVWTGAGNTLSMWDVADKKIHVTQSMMKELQKSPHFPKAKIRLTTGKSPDDLYLDLPTLAEIARPPVLIITLGLNGIALMSKEDFKGEYSRLITVLKEKTPDTQIFLNSVFPVGKDAAVSPEKVELANTYIKELALEHHLPYLDTHSLLKTESGYPEPSYLDTNDGIHWNKKGCIKIMEVLEHAYETLAKTPMPLV